MTNLLKLPRLPVGWKDQPQLFERYWDLAMKQIEASIDAILELPSIQAELALVSSSADAANTAANAANIAADNANLAAAAANTVANDAVANNALTNSGVTGITISAVDAGSNCTISISNHTRVYGDGVSVSVTGGSITGLAYSTLYYVYYDQASRAGGTVTYVATVVKASAAQVNDRHLVGSVTTPAALGSAVTGKYVDLSGLGSLV